MQNKFDELTKSLAQSVTRRSALKKFGVGLAGMALACFVGSVSNAPAAALGGFADLRSIVVSEIIKACAEIPEGREVSRG